MSALKAFLCIDCRNETVPRDVAAEPVSRDGAERVLLRLWLLPSSTPAATRPEIVLNFLDGLVPRFGYKEEGEEAADRADGPVEPEGAA